MALNINPNSAGSGAASATGGIASAAKGTTSATKGASASNNILSLLNSDDNASSNKSTGNFSGGDSTTSMRDQIKNANKSTGNQTVDDTFKIGSGTSKYNDDTVFVGAGGQTATLGEITSGVKNLSVDDVWNTGSNTGSNPNTPYNTDNTVQGDYQASKNESSKIETGTFGKQDEIVTNPNLVVQDKGLVKNDSIDSVGGLVTEQKDKDSQEVLDSKKKRDEAEADDASKKMRDRIRSVNDDTVIDDEARDFFKIGNEAGADEKAALDKAVDEYNKAVDELNNIDLNGAKAKQDEAAKIAEEAEKAADAAEQKFVEAKDKILIGHKWAEDKTTFDSNPTAYDGYIDDEYVYTGKDNMLAIYVAETNGLLQDYMKTADDYKAKAAAAATAAKDYSAALDTANRAKQKVQDLKKAAEEAEQNYKNVFTPATEPVEKTDLSEDADYFRGLYKLTKNPSYLKAAEALDAVNAQKKALEEQTAKIAGKDFNELSDADIAAWVDAQKKYTDNLNDALNSTEKFKQTDYNKNFTADIANANNFEVTYTDANGQVVTKTYADLATDWATKSPQIAAAMYRNKADQLEADGHKVLAKINRTLADWQENWFGSKVGFNDNKVRDQFNAMADLNMRATYAAYNNVLSDPNATPEEKENAKTAIDQANALKTASTALKASTGFFSGIGDGTSDGNYGNTDPGQLNGYQELLNGIRNFSQIILGFVVTPGANRAYQNFYYMNQGYLEKNRETSEAGVFTTDWDKDGFALCQEYGNSATAELIICGGELTSGIVMLFNPETASLGVQMIADSLTAAKRALYGVRGQAEKTAKMTEEITSWFKEASEVNGLPEDIVETLTNPDLTITEDFELKADEVENLDNWLEGSGSNTATNEKFNQSLSYDEWLKLIESDETMRNYAKKLAEVKKDKKEE